jgi:hypothetical protein
VSSGVPSQRSASRIAIAGWAFRYWQAIKLKNNGGKWECIKSCRTVQDNTMGKETGKLGVVKPQFSNVHGEKLGRFIFHP